MSQDVDFNGKLSSLVSVPVSENLASEQTTEPRVWWQRSNGNVELLNNGDVMSVDTTYDVEVYGLDIDAAAQVADVLKSSLNGFRGVMGDTVVLACWVKDHSDEYIPRSVTNEDVGFHVFAFQVQIQN